MNTELPIIDWAQHAQADSSEPTELSRELLTMFGQQLPTLRQAIEQAYANQDNDTLQASMHRLQGACAYCGLPRLRMALSDAGITLKKNGGITAEQYENIQNELALTEAELRKEQLI